MRRWAARAVLWYKSQVRNYQVEPIAHLAIAVQRDDMAHYCFFRWIVSSAMFVLAIVAAVHDGVAADGSNTVPCSWAKIELNRI